MVLFKFIIVNAMNPGNVFITIEFQTTNFSSVKLSVQFFIYEFTFFSIEYFSI